MSIPISGVYPIEVMMSGFYEVKEGDLNRGKLLTDHLVSSHFPTQNTGSKVKVFRTTGYGTYDNIVFQFQGSSSYRFYSVPLGGSAASWLWSKLPGIGSLSISFSYSKTSQSVVTYGIRVMNAPPNQLCYATILKLKRDIKATGDNIELAMYFTTIDDGTGSMPPCFGNVCPTSTNGGSKKIKISSSFLFSRRQVLPPAQLQTRGSHRTPSNPLWERTGRPAVYRDVGAGA
ncbi:hypothetical protein [Pyrococcus yayanosii]|uniref:hypothetical protein n=1 Tax=Pyrococcus yayanosii TaxID=1008460 RepID=UPI00187305E5|nr:hypothetical protein [Pyrococcus yayanosii]